MLVVDPWPVGTWDLIVWGPETAPARAQVHVGANAAAEIALVLDTASPCTIACPSSKEGQATLTFRRADGSERLIMALRNTGDDLVVGLRPGQWFVERRQRGIEAAAEVQELSVVPGQAARLTFGKH